MDELVSQGDGGGLSEVAELLTRKIDIEKRILDGAQKMVAMPGTKKEIKSRRDR